MRRIFFLLPLNSTFADLLINWIKEQYKGQGIEVHTLTLDDETRLQVFFDTQAHAVPGLIREYEDKFWPQNCAHIREGEFKPQVTATVVEVLL
ncbi:MAG: hypothetical protein JWP09_229 [Candidatus Taylorbacteria bacterium]|nr:hypothetical protein [Candidatus Taylorbacteria bacterium]